MTEFEQPEDEFDQLLASAMHARPVPQPKSGLARAAMARADARHCGMEEFRVLTRQRRRGALINLLAGVVIVGSLLIAILPGIWITNDSSVESSGLQVETSSTGQVVNMIWGISTEQFVVTAAATLVVAILLLNIEQILWSESSCSHGWKTS